MKFHQIRKGIIQKTILSMVCLSIYTQISAQLDTLKCVKGRKDIGAEIQVYPAGVISAFTANFVVSNQFALRFRAGGNFANRRNWSPFNDEEIAKGYGGSVGWVTYHPYKIGHFTAGATIDLWRMWTQWKDEMDSQNPKSGETYTLVVQPWADVGYLFHIRNTHLNIGTTMGFGREINVITKGERVGEGWMGSLTLTLNYTFMP